MELFVLLAPTGLKIAYRTCSSSRRVAFRLKASSQGCLSWRWTGTSSPQLTARSGYAQQHQAQSGSGKVVVCGGGWERRKGEPGRTGENRGNRENGENRGTGMGNGIMIGSGIRNESVMVVLQVEVGRVATRVEKYTAFLP